MKELIVVGLSHKTAPLDVRERCRAEELKAPLESLRTLTREVVLLSTCNRFEVYAAACENRDRIVEWIAERAGLAVSEIGPHVYVKEGRNAAKYLFFVTSSLDSLVVGETQIRSQVKKAYAAARNQESVGPLLHRLFQAALRVSKEISEATGVGRGTVSVAGAAAELAERVFGELGRARVVVLGAGETAELVLAHLTARGVKHIRVLNRTPERARALGERFGGEGHSLEKPEEHLHEADILVAAAGGAEPLISLGALRNALRRRRGRPMVVIDIATPRGVAPGAGRLDNVYRYDMDALVAVTQDALRHRRKDFLHCCTLIDAAALRLDAEERSHEAGRTIQEIEQQYEAIAEEELRLLENRLELGEEDREQVRRSIHRLVRKFLHLPVRALKDGGPEASDAVRRAFSGTRSDDE